jgi:hypothetical protein
VKSAQQDRPRYWAGGITFAGALLALSSFDACGQRVEVGLDDALSTAGTAGGGGMSSGGSLQLGGHDGRRCRLHGHGLSRQGLSMWRL